MQQEQEKIGFRRVRSRRMMAQEEVRSGGGMIRMKDDQVGSREVGVGGGISRRG